MRCDATMVLDAGICGPDHPIAGDVRFRTAVEDLVREPGQTVLRHPGGDVVSSYG